MATRSQRAGRTRSLSVAGVEDLVAERAFGSHPLVHPRRNRRLAGSREYSADRFFRRKLSPWLAEVKTIWPQCLPLVGHGIRVCGTQTIQDRGNR